MQPGSSTLTALQCNAMKILLSADVLGSFNIYFKKIIMLIIVKVHYRGNIKSPDYRGEGILVIIQGGARKRVPRNAQI